MSGPPAAANGVLVLGDAGGNLAFADASSGAVLASAALMYGALTSAPAIWKAIAFFGEGATQGSSFLHAYDLSAATIADLWSPGIQVSGSFDASPVVLGSTLWAVASDGNVISVGVGNPASPQPGAPVKVIPGTPAKVSAVLPMPNGSGLLAITNVGAYGINTASGTPTLAWQALTNLDLTAVAPALAGGELLVTNGSTVYALAPSPGSSTPSAQWQYAAPGAIAAVIAEGPQYATVLLGNGTAYMLNVSEQASRATFSLSLPSGAAAWTTVASGAYMSLAPSGAASANTVSVATAGTASATQAWSASAPGFAGPPIVSDTLVYTVGTDGALRVYDIGTGAVLVGGSLTPITGSRATVGAVAMGVRGLSSAAVRLVLDGADFFPTMRDLLIAVAQGSFAAPSAMPADTTFAGLIKAVGAAGAPAYVMAWDDSVAMHLGSTQSDIGNFATWRIAQAGAATLARQFTPGGALWPDQRLAAQMYQAIEGAPGCSTYLEPYYANLDQWYTLEPFELGSNHQKIAIFSVAGTKLALVSGFNVMGGYWDQPAHPMIFGGKYYGHSWHDTGVLLQGPAVDIVEAEFDRRWQKGRPAPVPGTDTYVKVAAWMIQPDSDFNPGNPPYQDRRLTSAQVPVRIARTVNERWAPFATPTLAPESVVSGVQDIRDNLVAAIATATSYVYLENFTFSDVGIAQAISNRLTAQPNLKAIVVVPSPTVGQYQAPIDFFNAQNELIRSAYAALLLGSHDWSTATVNTGDQFTPQNAVTLSFNPRGIEYTQVSFTKSGSTQTVNIRQIVAIQISATPSTAQVLFGSPARLFPAEPTDQWRRLQNQGPRFRGVYVHSKLALVDDRIAVIGSANFSRRSMVQDGELSAVIPDPATAQAIRTQIFGHWGMTTAAAWGQTAANFAASSAPGLGVLPLAYGSLPIQPITWSYWFLSLLIDPSQLN